MNISYVDFSMDPPDLSKWNLRTLLMFALASVPCLEYAQNVLVVSESADESVKTSFATALPFLLGHLKHMPEGKPDFISITISSRKFARRIESI